MGGYHWLEDEAKKFEEAARLANGDVRAFIYELRKAGSTRSLAQIYSRVNKKDTRPAVPGVDVLMRKLSSKVRTTEGLVKPSAMRPLRPITEPGDEDEVLEAKEEPAETNGHANGTVAKEEDKTKFVVRPVIEDSVLIKHIAYCILGEQLGRTTKMQAYDDIVETLKQKGVVR